MDITKVETTLGRRLFPNWALGKRLEKGKTAKHFPVKASLRETLTAVGRSTCSHCGKTLPLHFPS